MPEAFQMLIKSGRFLPDDDPTAPRAFAVLGSKLKQELFNDLNPLGQRITVGGNRFSIIGVMASKGNVLGFDMDDTVYIPASRALSLFNRDTLHEVDLLYDDKTSVETVVA
jgi:putative ABC transport system permease protein